MEHSVVTVEDRKNILTEKLSTQYSLNRLSLEEYERLIHYSQGIETEKELQIFEKIVKEYNREEQYTANGNNTKSYNRETVDNLPKNQFSILSSRKTTGALTSGNFMNILSDHKIIINEEDLINDETVLNFMVLLGSVVINVPEGVNVINEAVPIIGDVSVDDRINERGGIKRIKITGNVVLGDLKVKVKKKLDLTSFFK